MCSSSFCVSSREIPSSTQMPRPIALICSPPTGEETTAKQTQNWSSHCGTVEMNPTSNQEVSGSIPGLASRSGLRIQCCHETQLGSCVAAAVAVADSYSSDWTPSLKTSICCEWGPKKPKKKRDRDRERDSEPNRCRKAHTLHFSGKVSKYWIIEEMTSMQYDYDNLHPLWLYTPTEWAVKWTAITLDFGATISSGQPWVRYLKLSGMESGHR